MYNCYKCKRDCAALVKDMCRACYCKQWRAENPEYTKKKNKEHRQADPDYNRLYHITYSQTMQGKYAYLRGKAIESNRELALTYQQYCDIVAPGVCYYCNGPLSISGYGLDRTDNAPRYTTDNVVPCCHSCNSSKSNRYTFEAFCEKMQVGCR